MIKDTIIIVQLMMADGGIVTVITYNFMMNNLIVKYILMVNGMLHH